MEVIETITDKNNELNLGRNISVERGDVEAGSKTKIEQPMRRLKRKINVEQQESGWFFCRQCDYKTVSRRNLRRHIESKHEEAHYSCVQCDYKVGIKVSLKNHVESKHEGVCYSWLHHARYWIKKYFYWGQEFIKNRSIP